MWAGRKTFSVFFSYRVFGKFNLNELLARNDGSMHRDRHLSRRFCSVENDWRMAGPPTVYKVRDGLPTKSETHLNAGLVVDRRSGKTEVLRVVPVE
jgi:hypothetical protein